MRLTGATRLAMEMASGLMILGLATAGFVIAQGMAAGPTATSDVGPASIGTTSAGEGVPVDQPFNEIAEADASRGLDTPAASDAPDRRSPSPEEESLGASVIPPCDMGLSRVVEIDTTGGPEFGRQHLKGLDFLRDKEVVLTFDDGPQPVSTVAVLKALQDKCLKATFFEIGQYASWHPEITKQVIDAGMTVGTHTWSHRDLARKPYSKDLEKAAQEIEIGNSAVHMAAAGGPVAPFFRFPELQHSPRSLEYLAQRNIAIFSTDIDSRDFTMHRPEQVTKSVMDQLDKHGKGMILMHDFHSNTAEALPELLRQLKAAGYKVVHIVPKVELTTIPKYDEMFSHRHKLSSKQ